MNCCIAFHFNLEPEGSDMHGNDGIENDAIPAFGEVRYAKPNWTRFPGDLQACLSDVCLTRQKRDTLLTEI